MNTENGIRASLELAAALERHDHIAVAATTIRACVVDSLLLHQSKVAVTVAPLASMGIAAWPGSIVVTL